MQNVLLNVVVCSLIMSGYNSSLKELFILICDVLNLRNELFTKINQKAVSVENFTDF